VKHDYGYRIVPYVYHKHDLINLDFDKPYYHQIISTYKLDKVCVLIDYPIKERENCDNTRNSTIDCNRNIKIVYANLPDLGLHLKKE